MYTELKTYQIIIALLKNGVSVIVCYLRVAAMCLLCIL